MICEIISEISYKGKDEYNKHLSTTINHFYEKLFRLPGLMNTHTAKDMAREVYMKDYISQFMEEWEGIR